MTALILLLGLLVFVYLIVRRFTTNRVRQSIIVPEKKVKCEPTETLEPTRSDFLERLAPFRQTTALLIHSGNPLSAEKLSDPRPEGKLASRMKPHGLWFSIGTAFFEWEEEESFYVTGTQYLYEIVLQPRIKEVWTVDTKAPSAILVVDGSNIHQFATRYISNNRMLPALYEDFAGILFRDHKKDQQLPLQEYFWYYAVDGASGCIWDNDCISQLRLIK